MTLGRLLLLVAAVATTLAHARAAPLDADSCAKLKEEHGQLELAGVEADMAKGPEWAIVNLAPEKLKQVQRFIEVEELLLFRCRDKSLVDLPLENDTAPTSDANKQAKEKAAPKAKKAAPKANKKAEPTKKAAAKPVRKPRQTKQVPGAGSAKSPAKAAAKRPAVADDDKAAPPAKK